VFETPMMNFACDLSVRADAVTATVTATAVSATRATAQRALLDENFN
jgi:hypothetical protein